MFALTSPRIGWRWPCWRPQAEMHCSHFKVILYFILEVSVQAVLSHVKQPAPATIYCGKPWSNTLWEHLPSYCIITWNNLEPAIVLTRVAMSQPLLEVGEAQKIKYTAYIVSVGSQRDRKGQLVFATLHASLIFLVSLTGSHTTIYTLAHLHFSGTGYHFLHGQN